MSKRIVIAGGSHGIGNEIAKQCIAEHYKVIALSRTTGLLNLNEIESFHEVDFMNPNTELPQVNGYIDGIVYAPGSIRLKPFKSLTDKDIVDDFNLNILGAVHLIKHLIPNLNNASIILFSTVAVAVGMPYHTSIAISKGAVEGLMRALAAELAPNTRVNAIAPSLTNTPLSESLINTESKLLSGQNRHPLKQIGDAKDVASIAMFLLSNQSKFITGQVVRPDGGVSAIRLL